MPPHFTELMFISLINFKLGRRRPNQPPSTYLTCHWLVLQLPISRLIMHDNSTIPIATNTSIDLPSLPLSSIGNVYGHYRLCAPRTTTTSNSYSWSRNMSAYMWTLDCGGSKCRI
ncbi:hypothetical protein QC761_210710 [Podospora bellae-mahoneyi]|uniref:Uncharacterized protein n=1 Tax=Podospora bellae-mahoneyi TaxID=2093777 RepID=A0ABR0FR78_9PEZI|nr:hypothetical protein QC761_210710 [Podospora bellae-mahoneyi]